MSTLYNIEKNISDIFAEIEENGGEITPEQELALQINENELKTKLTNYRHAITEWEGDIEKCKLEVKRINDIKKIKTNRIEKLKSSMLFAVENFGNKGKTNKFIELEDCRLFTRNSASCEIDGERCEILKQEFLRLIIELSDNRILYTGEDVDLEGICDSINANCKALYGENFKLFTIDDLLNFKINISVNYTINHLLKWNRDILEHIANNINSDNIEIDVDQSTKETSNILKNDINITYASLVNNTSLNIK